MTARVGSIVTFETAQRCVAELEAAIDDVFAGLRAMAGTLEDVWRRRAAPLEPAGFAAFEPHIFAQLDARQVYDSAGYIMNTAAMAGGERHLEWWHRGSDGSVEKVRLPLRPEAPDCYDYYAMDWFIAALEGRRFVSGPKIDLPCADVYIMTCTEPAIVDGVVLGAAGADVALARFETKVLPPLRRIDAPAVLVNELRRVISSNDARWIGGEKLPAIPDAGNAEWQAVIPVTADLGWYLAIHR